MVGTQRYVAPEVLSLSAVTGIANSQPYDFRVVPGTGTMVGVGCFKAPTKKMSGLVVWNIFYHFLLLHIFGIVI